MAEPIGVISGIIGLLLAATKLSTAISHQIDAIRGVPRTLQLLSTDLKAFRSVLDTLKSSLDREDTANGVLHPAVTDELQRVLGESVRVFAALDERLRSCLKDAGSKMGVWRRVRMSLKMREFKEVREELMVQKATLNVTVTVANFISITSQSGTTVAMQRELTEVRGEITTLLAKMEAPEKRTTREGWRIEAVRSITHRYGSSSAGGARKLLGSRPGSRQSTASALRRISLSSSMTSFHSALSTFAASQNQKTPYTMGQEPPEAVPWSAGHEHAIPELDDQAYDRYDPYGRLRDRGE